MLKTDKIYGARPVDLGLIDLSPTEMMFWMYCPIKMPDQNAVTLPPNLEQYRPLINAALMDCGGRWRESYVYLTAKTLWCTPENPGNRPGWHSDGFLTDDLNYIWSDRSPTVFFHDGSTFAFTADHNVSLQEMEAIPKMEAGFDLIRYPNKHLLRLDQTVIHKTDTDIDPGIRTFVKISVSRHRYALEGNSINHALATDWNYQPRKLERNCPIGDDRNDHHN